MAGCPKCGFDNPAESRFCAGCGAPLPVSGKCPGCGADNPPGSRFCKQCGKALTGGPDSGGGSKVDGSGGSLGTGSNDLHTVKVMLWVAIGVIGYAAFLNYSSMETMQAYLGPYADTSTSTFLLVLDGVLAALSGYAAVQLEQGETGLAKKALLADAVVGGIALFLFHGSLQEIMLNGGLLAIGVWGLHLLNRSQRRRL